MHTSTSLFVGVFHHRHSILRNTVYRVSMVSLLIDTTVSIFDGYFTDRYFNTDGYFTDRYFNIDGHFTDRYVRTLTLMDTSLIDTLTLMDTSLINTLTLMTLH